ncbi:acetyl-CoA carboxylase biotin carboxyl carrier protein subunit [Rudaea sp.]|uniref:acetyl-CoA carboxylase biotin carboxyl carrier protein subunit n=1 Tax=Rudaea sp. TaxID=2136325 RepID=UPI0039E288E9
MHHAFRIGDEEYAVELSRSATGYRLHRDERSDALRVQGELPGRATLIIDGREFDLVVAVAGDDVHVHLDGETFQLRHRHPLERLAMQGQGSADDTIRAPMPGSIVLVAVAVGDAVARGQTLLVMESMKMETTLIAPRDGVVQAVHFAQGRSFERDAVLLSLEPQA